MTTSAETAPEQLKMSMAARIGWIVLICVTLYVCYFSHLGAIGFVGPDEPRYAWVAREMLETGDWITPRLYGRPWFEKPPLYYWGAATCFKLFGVSEAAARLPSAISALLATLAMAWLAWRVYGAETARWVLLLLPTTVGMIGFSHAAATDMPFSAMLTVAMVCAAVIVGVAGAEDQDGRADAGKQNHEGLEPEGSCQGGAQLAAPLRRNGVVPYRLLAIILFGFFLGLAVLAKGPAGVILCGGAVSFWALFTKRWRDALRLLHPAGILAFCATALPWYILCARRNPDFFRVFIMEHNFKRYLTQEFQHIQPFWFYVPVFLVAFLPWTALLAWSIIVGANSAVRLRTTSPLSTYLLGWALFCVAFFSFSRSKLPGYVLPAIPAVGALMVSTWLYHGPIARRSLRIPLFSTAALFLFIALVLDFSHLRSSRQINDVDLIAFAIGAANFALAAIPIRGQSVDQLARTACVTPVLVIMLLAHAILPVLFPRDPSARTLARQLGERRIPTEKLYVDALNRSVQYGLSFYLHREIRAWDGKTPHNEYILLRSRTCDSVIDASSRCEQIPFDLSYESGYFLYRVTNDRSAGAAGGKAQ